VPRPPKPHRRRVWIYLLVGSVVVILGLAVASGTIWIQKVKPPIDAANAYLRDIRRGSYRAAFAQLCARERVDGSPRSLADTVDRLVVFGLRNYEVSPFDVHIEGSRATVQADLNKSSGGTVGNTVRIRLEKIGGTWRPCGGEFGFEDARLTPSAI
jgi:hypothetical protein